MPDEDRAELLQLRQQVESLRDSVQTLHRVSTLLRDPLEVDAVLYAILTGVTAGVGLGFNRAILFVEDAGELRARGAVGPADGEEADRVWRAIVDAAPDLEDLYQAGLMHRDAPSGLDRQARERSVDPQGTSPVAIALRESRLVRGEGDDDLGGLLHLPTCVAVPLRGRLRRGVLYADNRFTQAPADETRALIFSLVAEQAGRAVARARAYEVLEHEARTDALTGLPHRRSLRRALDSALYQAERDGHQVGFAMIDLDDFKRVNDSLGHPAGDAVLVEFTERAQRVLRSGEAIFRYGGEEFVLLLPDADIAGAKAAAERVRAAVAESAFGCGARVTCSIGVAASSGRDVDADTLLAAADAALLAAKREGKDRVMVVDVPDVPGADAC